MINAKKTILSGFIAAALLLPALPASAGAQGRFEQKIAFSLQAAGRLKLDGRRRVPRSHPAPSRVLLPTGISTFCPLAANPFPGICLSTPGFTDRLHVLNPDSAVNRRVRKRKVEPWRSEGVRL
jgi:hypothetical protein